MTHAERIAICSVCTKRAFNPKQGIICSLTKEKADFEGSCADYHEDSKEVRIEKQKIKSIQSDTNKSNNKGRYALFIIGGLYVIVGFVESYIINGHQLLFGIIDWIVAAVFIGLGVWSYTKASLAMIIGLSFYIGIMLLLFALEPSTLLKGVIWKGLVIYYLIYAIKTAREEEAKQKPESDDILDQI